LPKTDYLNGFNIDIKDYDQNNLITYSLINNKIYQAYLTILKAFEPDYKRSKEFEKNPIQKKVSQDDMINFVTNEVARNIKLSTDFLKQVPGFGEMSNEELTHVIKSGMMNFHVITVSPMIKNGESYMVFENGINLSRKWLNKMRGKEKTDLKIQAAEGLNELNITDREKALLLVYMYTLPGIYD
jgi:hypothetical protein